MLSNHLVLYFLLLLLPSIFPSIRVFSNKLALYIRWPEYWSFSISPSKEYSGLIFCRIDWFDLLGSPRDSQESSSAPQFESISSLACSLLYDPALTCEHDYRKNHSFDWQTFVGKAMSRFFNMLSRLVIAFLSRSHCLLISWLQTPSIVIIHPKKITSVIVSIVSPSICY